MSTATYSCIKCGKTNTFDTGRNPQLLIEGRTQGFEIKETPKTKPPQVLILTCRYCGERNRIEVY